MRFAQLTARALMGGLLLETLPEHRLNSTYNSARLAIRQSSCDIGEEQCSDGCMPAGSDCCAAFGRETFCDPGYYCLEDSGCCQDGATCGDDSAGCPAGRVACNNACMPVGAVCCPDRGYCDAGYFCGTDDYCYSDEGDSTGDPVCGDLTSSLCDDTFCIPADGVCCGYGEGEYCDAGYYCVDGGCCKKGQTCGDDSSGTDDDDGNNNGNNQGNGNGNSNGNGNPDPTPTNPRGSSITFGVTANGDKEKSGAVSSRTGAAGCLMVAVAAGVALFILIMSHTSLHPSPLTGLDAVGDGQIAEPCTFVAIGDERLVADVIERALHRFGEVDDVWSPEFLSSLVVQTTLPAPSMSSGVPETPQKFPLGLTSYNMAGYKPHPGCFQKRRELLWFATVPGDESNTFRALDMSANGEEYLSTLTVAVPSRLYFVKTPEKPYAGLRLAIKDIIDLKDLKGLKTAASSLAYPALHPPRTASAEVVQWFIDLGFVVVGKVKTTQFADSEWPTCDWIDYHAPFNPRGDGCLATSGSSAGSAASVAAYEWLDFSLGTDKANKLLYPTDYWPATDGPSQEVFEAFIVRLEEYLGIKRTKLSLEDSWREHRPSGITESLTEYLEHAFEWAANPDQWTGTFRDFLPEFEARFGKPPVLNPQVRFKWPQKFRGDGFFFYNIGPYAEAPELIIPGNISLTGLLTGVGLRAKTTI
ncbi:hypothetical protein VTJ49DRAFT_7407 [Mycothermus thermophilus]|uniref:Amidase domain-containing protein n=1 Tax=Humicola insolens TaxID=85995 RepID=A0ABR3VHZ9_HUMIN